MDIPTMYRMVNHLDAPKRMLTLTTDEFLVVLLSLMLFVISNHKVMVGALGFSFLAALKHTKKGRGPRFLLVLAYWNLPSFMTRWMLTHIPASYFRVWKA
jgi:conjugal transfer pilus assembly protein TraL